HHVHPTRPGYLRDGVQGFIDKHPHRRAVRRELRHDTVRLFWSDIARTRWIEDQADHIGTSLHRYLSVVSCGDTANFDFGHTFWLVLDTLRTRARSKKQYSKPWTCCHIPSPTGRWS